MSLRVLTLAKLQPFPEDLRENTQTSYSAVFGVQNGLLSTKNAYFRKINA